MNNATLKCFHVLDPTSSQRVYFGILYTILTTVSMTLNTLLIRLILLQRIKTRGIMVYKLTMSLDLSSMIYLLCNYPMMLPCTFRECTFYTDSLMITVSSLNTLGYYTSFWTNTYIAIERISLFLSKATHDLIERFVYAFLTIPWIIGGFITAGTLIMGCYKRFNTYSHTYTFGCAKCILGASFNVTQFLFWLSQALSVLMFIGYAAIIVKFKYLQKTSNQKNKRNDIRLVLQFSVICTFQWFSCFFFYMVPFVFGTSFQGSLALNISGMGNTMVNPIILMVFNKTIRDGLLRLLRLKQNVVQAEMLISVVHRTRMFSSVNFPVTRLSAFPRDRNRTMSTTSH